MKIYVVMETYGQYSDRDVYPIAAYKTKRRALAKIAKEEDNLKKIVAEKGPHWDKYSYELQECELL